MPPVAIYFYDVVLSVHIASIVVAFGLVFAYPVLTATIRRHAPRAMAGFHEASVAAIRYVLTPGAVLAFIAGAYMASDRDLWNKSWVSVPMVILFAVVGIAHGFLAPRERRAAELAGQGDAAPGAGYEATARQLGLGAALAGGLVLVAIFFMTAKPGGY